MKCEKCGNDINPNEKFCTNCGNPVPVVEQPTPEVVTSPVPVDTNYITAILTAVLAILYFGSSLIAGIINFVIGDSGLSNAITSLAALGPLAGIILMIVTRVKYPDNKFAKVLMWIYIIQIILAIIGFILLVAFCYVMCGSCEELGSMGMILWR